MYAFVFKVYILVPEKLTIRKHPSDNFCIFISESIGLSNNNGCNE